MTQNSAIIYIYKYIYVHTCIYGKILEYDAVEGELEMENCRTHILLFLFHYFCAFCAFVAASNEQQRNRIRRNMKRRGNSTTEGKNTYINKMKLK